MKIWYSQYKLIPKNISKNIKYSNEGVLLKFENEKYSLYHPIESLGDPSLKDFVKSLSEQTPLLDKIKKASVGLKDFEALMDKQVKCYYSAPNLSDLIENKDKIINEGFESVKFKVSSVGELEEMVEDLKNLPLTYVFDFNGRGEKKDFIECSEKVKDFLKEKVLYVEDPLKEFVSLPYMRVASDFEDYGGEQDFTILKPTAFAHEQQSCSSRKSVVTSYLDHPLGQIMSTKWALDNGVENSCGLLSHTYYQANPYSEKILSKGPFLELKSAQGLFELLEQELWQQV
ncbi:MAG: hypothetical protein ACRBBP_09930 [Bdellovibrionales bacterium]